MPYIGKMKNEMMSGLICDCGHDYICHSPTGNECCECDCTLTRASIVSAFVNQLQIVTGARPNTWLESDAADGAAQPR